jgi:hypothetical protein
VQAYHSGRVCIWKSKLGAKTDASGLNCSTLTAKAVPLYVLATM